MNRAEFLNKWKARRADMLALKNQGYTYKDIAKKYRIYETAAYKAVARARNETQESGQQGQTV